MSNDTTATVQRCTKCAVEKPVSDFYINRPGQYRRECKPCHLAGRAIWRDANRAKIKQTYYGITEERYAALMESQGGVCAICRQPETEISPHGGVVGPLQIDHDHRCCPGRKRCGECVRGLLCGRCNKALGLLQDDAGLVLAAAAYLTRSL